MDLEGIMVSEISHGVKDNYPMISCIYRIYLKNKPKNPTKLIEKVSLLLGVQRWGWGGGVGELQEDGRKT